MNTLLQKKKIISIGLLLLLLLAIPLTIFITQQEQDIRQEAARPNIQQGLAQVGSTVITQEELQKKVAKIYQSNTTDQKALQPLLDELIEEKLLQQASQELGISVNTSDVQAEMNEQGIASIDSDSPLKTEIDAEILREKITRKVAKTRDAFTVGFWIPPENYDVPLTPEQRALVEQQRRDAEPALLMIEERMRRGDNPLTIARETSLQYPSLQSIMAVNGYILSRTPNESLLQQSVLYEYETERANVAYFKQLFETGVNQVTVVKETGTSDGGSVIKVVGVTEGRYNNYQEWLKEQKNARVRKY